MSMQRFYIKDLKKYLLLSLLLEKKERPARLG
jgi:hypothetical protein